jgi:hypothetical protein
MFIAQLPSQAPTQIMSANTMIFFQLALCLAPFHQVLSGICANKLQLIRPALPKSFICKYSDKNILAKYFYIF